MVVRPVSDQPHAALSLEQHTHPGDDNRAAEPAQREFNTFEDYINDPRRVAQNQELPRAPLIPYYDTAAAIRRDEATTPWVKSLDGLWHFEWSETLTRAPENFYEPACDVSDWDTIRVPSFWQTEGYDHAIYRNTQLPFWPYDDTSWAIPKDLNPVGSYVRTFIVPPSWTSRRTLLRFEGVQSAFFVWINGTYVGYDQGGMTPAEFDVTEHVVEGDNMIAVRVFRWSTASYLENFDYWHLAGIYRSVTLQSVPPIRIRDLHVVTELDAHYKNAILRLTVDFLDSSAEAREVPLSVSLHDPAGAVIDHLESVVSLKDGTGMTTLERVVIAPKLWSDEYPYLYTLVLEVGETPDRFVTSERVGFRQWDVHEATLRLNGNPVTIRGVNYIGHDHTVGRAMTAEMIRADLSLMRQFNINAIRNAHFPKDPALYHLADEYGILVCDEVDVETHARILWNSPASRPEWREAFLDRAQAMIHRTKNRPCVFMWSTGNEAGTGAHHLEMADVIREVDSTRPLYHQPGAEGDAPWAHVHGPRYPTFDTARRYLHTAVKPVLFGEYMHSMGNSLGGFHDLWTIIREYPSGQGGFIWDWMDQALRQRLITTPDKSDNNIVAHLNGRPSIVDGLHGKALQLSGLDDWVEIAPHPALDITGTELTLDVWLKPDLWTAPGNGQILAKGNNQYGLQLHDTTLHINPHVVLPPAVDPASRWSMQAPQAIEFYVHTGQRQSLIVPLPGNWAHTWHRLTGVYDGTTMRLYLDGTQVGLMPNDGPITFFHDTVFLGRNNELVTENSSARTGNATFDRVRIYSYALPETTIAAGADPNESAVLALDFDTYHNNGHYDSFGTSPFILDGLVYADRRPKPALHQVKYTHAPIQFRAIDTTTGRISISNEHHSTNLSAYNFTWLLRADGDPVRGGSFTTTGAPGETVPVQISKNLDDLVSGGIYAQSAEYLLEVQAVRREQQPGVPAGYAVTRDQWVVHCSKASAPAPTHAGAVQACNVSADSLQPVTVDETPHEITVAGKGWRYLFDTTIGTLASLRVGDRELLARGPLLNVWRDPTSNDEFHRPAKIASQWRRHGLDRLRHTARHIRLTRTTDDAVRIEIDAFAACPQDATDGFASSYIYTVSQDGTICLNNHVTPCGDRVRGIDYLPRVGLELGLPHNFRTLNWYGRGPIETATDRMHAGHLAIHTTDAYDHEPYIPPQHSNLKTDVRWATICDDGIGLIIEGDPTFNLEVTQYRNRDRAAYPHHLVIEDHLRVMIDHKTSGVGETLRTGLQPAYQLTTAETYEYTLALRPSTSLSVELQESSAQSSQRKLVPEA